MSLPFIMHSSAAIVIAGCILFGSVLFYGCSKGGLFYWKMFRRIMGGRMICQDENFIILPPIILQNLLLPCEICRAGMAEEPNGGTRSEIEYLEVNVSFVNRTLPAKTDTPSACSGDFYYTV